MTFLDVAARISLALGLSLMTMKAFGQGGQLQGAQERTITPGHADRFSVDLKKDQFLTLSVTQKGIDVGIAVIDPEGVEIRFVDGADGGAGTENVAVVAESTGQYQFEVRPLDRFRNPAPGRYEIRIAEIRDATELELREGRVRGLLKIQGLKLLDDIEQLLQEVRDAQTRAQFQLRTANLLWGTDEARAARLMNGALDSLNQLFAAVGSAGTNRSEDFSVVTQLRRQLIDAMVSREPEVALTYLHSTRAMADPDNTLNNRQWEQSVQAAVANRIVMTNPQRSFDIVEEALKEGTTQEMMGIVRGLQSKSPDLAAALMRDIVIKLGNQRLVADASTAGLAATVIEFAREVASGARSGVAGRDKVSSVIAGPEFASFYQKAVNDVLGYSPTDTGYGAERHAALGLAQALASNRANGLPSVSADRASALSRKATQLGVAPAAAQSAVPNINSVTVDQGLSIAERAPLEARDSLYRQLANKAATEGDMNRAQQIINEYLPPSTRAQALSSARQQAVYTIAANGNFEEALRLIQSEPSGNSRVAMLEQIVSSIGPGLKISTAASLLQQIRSMLDPSPRAGGDQEMNTLLAISAAVAKLSPTSASSILEPLIDQFNDLSLSAAVMNGFPEKYYRNGDLMMTGSNLATMAREFGKTLADLALIDLPRAKASAERIRPVTARIEIYLQMAAKATRSSSLSD